MTTSCAWVHDTGVSVCLVYRNLAEHNTALLLGIFDLMASNNKILFIFITNNNNEPRKTVIGVMKLSICAAVQLQKLSEYIGLLILFVIARVVN